MIEIIRLHDVPLRFNLQSFINADLEDINFHRCILNNLDFANSKMVNIDFRSAKINNSMFVSAEINKSRLIMVEAKNTNFKKSCFKQSLLLHSDFSNSSFELSDLSEAIINNVRFCGCDLRGANLSCSGLETCVFEGAIFDDSTIWNDNFDAVNYGAIKK